MVRCVVCKGVSELRHEERQKDYCYKCWSRICDKRMKDDIEQEKKDSGQGLYKWVI